jgi:hypothetical protein
MSILFGDGVEFGKTIRITDIAVYARYELYVDVITVGLDRVLEVLRRGVKACYLRRLDMIERRREKLC